MTDRFDDLTRAMAKPASRRSALKVIGATMAAADGAVVLRPFQSEAVTCPAGSPVCGQGCCPKGGTCVDPTNSCCCPKGATPCGTNCCASGVACIDRTRGLCGCPAGTTPCGTGANLTCCPAGQACSPTSNCPTAVSFNTATACISGTTTTTTASICSTAGDLCGPQPPPCPNNPTCSCVTRAGSGAPVCGDSTQLSAGCTTDADCTSGSVCIHTSCGNFCIVECGGG